MKRLFQKEWQENRSIPLWCALLLALMAVAGKVLNLGHVGMAAEMMYSVWLLAGILAGSGLISREVGSGSLQFALSLPVSRGRLWCIKAAAGACVLLATMALTGVVGFGLTLLLGGDLGMPEGWEVCAGTAACFGVSMALSVLVDRPVTAAMMSIVVCIGLFIPIAIFNLAFTLPGADDFSNIFIPIAACIPALFAASYWSFTRGESLRTLRRYGWGGAALLTGLVLTWSCLAGGYSYLSRFHRYSSEVSHPRLSPDGALIALEATGTTMSGDLSSAIDPADWEKWNSDPLAHHLVVESLDGSLPRQVLPAGQAIAWSPDGHQLLYRNMARSLGLRAGMGKGQVCWLDVRTGRRRPLDMQPYVAYYFGDNEGNACWSPDGKWLAIQRYGPVNQSGQAWGHTLYLFRGTNLPEGEGNLRPQASLTLDQNIGSGSGQSIISPENELVSTSGCTLGWSNDSQFLYSINNNHRLLAIRPSGSVPRQGPRVTTLCETPSDDGRIDYASLKLTHNSQRTLAVILHIDGARTKPASAGHSTASPTSHEERYVIDLQAATAQALQRPQKGPLPDMKSWLRRWSVKAVPTSLPDTGTRISPDGRYLLWPSSRNTAMDDFHIPRNFSPAIPNALRPRDPAPFLYLDMDSQNPKPRELPVITPYFLRQRWLPDGHRFYFPTDEGGHEWRLADLSTGKVSPLLLGDSLPLGSTPDGSLLLRSRQVRDVFYPVERRIKL